MRPCKRTYCHPQFTVEELKPQSQPKAHHCSLGDLLLTSASLHSTQAASYYHPAFLIPVPHPSDAALWGKGHRGRGLGRLIINSLQLRHCGFPPLLEAEGQSPASGWQGGGGPCRSHGGRTAGADPAAVAAQRNSSCCLRATACLSLGSEPSLRIWDAVLHCRGAATFPGPATVGTPGGPGMGRASMSGPPGDAGPYDEVVPRQSEHGRGRGIITVPGRMEGANQVPNSPRLHLRLRHKRGLRQSDSPRSSGARPTSRALHVPGDDGGVGAARDRSTALGQGFGLGNYAPAAPCATLVPALPPPGGDRDARRPGRRRSVQRCLWYGPGPASHLARPSGCPPRIPRFPESRPLTPADVSRSQRDGGEGRAGPGRGHPGGRLQPYPGLIG